MKTSGAWRRARRPIRIVFTSFIASWLTLALGAQKPAQAPVFKTKVEVVQLDVSVLDKHRQPVRGLTRKDFTILEDGKPQPIVGFATFDVDTAEAPATGWMRDVAPDVATNQHKETRLLVIVMDDGLIPQDPFAIQSSKKIAASIIDKLGPDDLTAIVFTGDNRKTQDFTSDKSKLRAALDKFNPGLASYRFGLDAGTNEDIWFYQATIRTLDGIADHLASVSGQRKMVFWISPGVPMDLGGAVPRDKDGCAVPERWDPKTGVCTTFGGNALSNGKPICLTGPGTCGPGSPMGVVGRALPPFEMSDLAKRIDEVFRRAQRANVTIYPIDPNGLDGSRAYLVGKLGPMNQGFSGHKATAQLDFLTMTAENTGGHAIINTNDFEPGIAEAFEENESYYLIGFEPTNTAADGKLRRLEVKVDRPDVEVRTRSSYYAPEPPKPDKKANAKNAPTPEAAALAKAMSGILPMAGMPMRVSVAPFAVPGQRLSTVTIVLGIRQPIPAAAAKDRVTETTELLTSAFTPEGDARGTQKHTARVVLRAGSDGEAAYEVLARIDLPAGRYQLRLAAHNGTSGRDGSVFADVTVPDYSNMPFSAAPVVLGVTPGRVSAPKDLLASLLPFVPTAERDFARADKLAALLRLYQNGQKPVERVQVSIQVRDSRNQLNASQTQTIGADRFTAVERPIETSPNQVALPRLRGLPTPTPEALDKFANLGLRTADVKYDVPLATLSPGPHLLTFEATLGTTTIRRDVRFEVR
jgi:VWFA-related protein